MNKTKFYFVRFSYLIFALGIGTGLVAASGEVGSRAGLTGIVIILFALLLLFVITKNMVKLGYRFTTVKKDETTI